MPAKKAIIFDFDGTIADTLSLSIEIVNKYSEKYGYRKIKTEELPHLKEMTPLQLLKEFKIPFYKVPFFASEFQGKLHKKMGKAPTFPGIVEVLQEIKASGILLIIVTSNSQENVEEFLKAHSMKMFDFVHSERNLFGKSRSIKNVLKKFNLKNSEVLYVGDEVRDIEAAKKSKIDIASVTWGFNGRKILEKYKPTFLVDTPKDLLKFI